MGRRIAVLHACIAWRLLMPSLAANILPINLTEAEWRNLESGRKEDFGPVLRTGMEQVFAGTNASLFRIRPGEVFVERKIEGFLIDGECRHHASAHEGKAVGTNTKASHMFPATATKKPGKKAEVFATAILKSEIKLATVAEVRLGRELFGQCHWFAKKSVNFHVNYSEETRLDLTLHFSNPRTQVGPGGARSLAFGLDMKLLGTAIASHVDGLNSEHHGEHGCEVKVGGIRAFSVCGRIENLVRDHVPVLVDQVVPLTAPKIINRLEEYLGATVGQQVVIPVNILAPEHQNLYA